MNSRTRRTKFKPYPAVPELAAPTFTVPPAGKCPTLSREPTLAWAFSLKFSFWFSILTSPPPRTRLRGLSLSTPPEESHFRSVYKLARPRLAISTRAGTQGCRAKPWRCRQVGTATRPTSYPLCALAHDAHSYSITSSCTAACSGSSLPDTQTLVPLPACAQGMAVPAGRSQAREMERGLGFKRT